MRSSSRAVSREFELNGSSTAQLISTCSLSEQLYLPLPSLPTATQKSDSILIGSNSSSQLGDTDELVTSGGKWEDEEERRFFEDVQDLKDFVPNSFLGIDGTLEPEEAKETEKERIDKEKEEIRKLEEELQKLNENNLVGQALNGAVPRGIKEDEEAEE